MTAILIPFLRGKYYIGIRREDKVQTSSFHNPPASLCEAKTINTYNPEPSKSPLLLLPNLSAAPLPPSHPFFHLLPLLQLFMQSPTCTGIRIRSARDANILFHAVALNLLPLITRRLDEAERLQVRSGCVYVWEERNPSYFDFNGQEMKRFTEGASIPALCSP